MYWKSITNLTENQLAYYWGEDSTGMQPLTWRAMPLHGICSDIVTEWGIFCLEFDQKPGGDIFPVKTGLTFWEAVDIVRKHNHCLLLSTESREESDEDFKIKPESGPVRYDEQPNDDEVNGW